MDTFKDCLCLSSTDQRENAYEEIELRSVGEQVHDVSPTPSRRISDSEMSMASQQDTVSLFCRLLTHEAYIEMEANPFATLYNVLVIRLDNHRDPLLRRALMTTDIHDVFSLIKRYLELWRLPCILVVRPDGESITGLTPLAIGSTAAVNWITPMLGNASLMKEYFRYAGLHFTEDTRSAVATPRHCLPITRTPANTPTFMPRTQTRVRPSSMARTPTIPNQRLESDDDTIPDEDLTLYHRAMVHNY